MQQYPPELDRLEFGRTSEGRAGAYCPVPLRSIVEVVPSDMLKLINTAAAVTAHAPHKYAIFYLPIWLVHFSACVKARQPAEIPILFP